MQDTPIDELELSVRAFSALLDVGNLTLGDLVINTKPLLRELVGAQGELEVRRLLASHELRLADDVGIDVWGDEPTPGADSAPWGALFVWREGGTTEEVVAAVDAAYARANLQRTSADASAPAGAPWLRAERELVADDVLVEPQEEDGWFAVMCARQEWCAPGAHPLARALSRAGEEVVSMTSAPGAYTEITVYEGGAPSAWRVTGRTAPDTEGVWEEDPKALEREGVAAFEARWFLDRGALGTPEEIWVAARKGDLDAFGAMTGCEARGHAQARAEGAEGAHVSAYR